MEKSIIQVPKGIRYISEFEEKYGFHLEEFPHIIDKKVPGCGFTHWCLSNSQNIILASPRKMLMENKKRQFKNSVFLVTVGATELGVDKDLNKFSKYQPEDENNVFDRDALKRDLAGYVVKMWVTKSPVKIIVTYDSYRKVKEILTEFKIFDSFFTIVDEFQSIFTDSAFKSSTEIEFLSVIEKGVQKVCFVSATPMMDNYLQLIPFFANIKYYEFDWVTLEPNRIKKPIIHSRALKSVNLTAKSIIEPYKNGKFEQRFFIDPVTHQARNVESREAVIYINSVTNIIGIIKACDLKPEEVNILCSDTPFNRKRIKSKLNRKKEGLEYTIGTPPLRNEPRKMFTFCTRTVYLGADFYSDNARTFIISDANIETMAVDITLDLPQILGRQRLFENPWKDEVTIYIKTLLQPKKISHEEYMSTIEAKLKVTDNLLKSFEDTRDSAKLDLAKVYMDRARDYNYKNDYVAVNKHAGSLPIPVRNDLVIIAEHRAFDIQQYDYDQRCSVYNRLIEEGNIVVSDKTLNAEAILAEFDKLRGTSSKMKYLCELKNISELELDQIFADIPDFYRNFYYGLGIERCRALGYNYTKMQKDYSVKMFGELGVLQGRILEIFKVGEKYIASDIKQTLGDVYTELGYKKTPKATDLEQWFDIKLVKVKNPNTGKWDRGFELTGTK